LKRAFKFFLNKVPRPFLIKISYWVSPIIAFLYNGDRYTDPIDGKSYRSFLPYGYENQRENVLAPGTLSLERHRLLWLYLVQTDFFSKELKLLHFAPEQAFYKRFKVQKNLDYTTTDIESPLATVKADICALPFENDQYDVILCNHVLEHIPDDHKAMRELYRVMKPGGWGIFQIPLEMNRLTSFQDDSITDPKKRAEIFGQYDHVRVYGMDYFDKLRAVGFEVDQVLLQNKLTSEQIQRYGLNPHEILPLCRKPINS
jgi:SAM-dependent methyltransferase